MYIGVDYYPEHWPKERWETDARLMQEAGFNIVRLAEFAWINMEPEEGTFTFDWLDEPLEILRHRGISAILGTPTAVMPAWLARKYPETLATQKDGTRIAWGVRKNNCFSAGAFRLLSERVTRAMTTHYAKHRAIVGWQTDNELGFPDCYCDGCRSSFQDFLRQKYKTLDELNRAWGTHFWGHAYKSWQEITIPIDREGANPGACLDWQRHYSWLNVRFQRDQVKIIRADCPKHFITHNCMGMFKGINYYDLAKDLDFMSWDNYPTFGRPDVGYDAAMAGDFIRGLKGKNYWIMEQTAGPCGWGVFGRNTRPDELRAIAYQQLAHGADAQIWFRWRTCTAGREQYWHGLLGHDGRALRRYADAKRTATEYHAMAKQLEGTTVQSDVAFIYDYDSLWTTDIQPGFRGNESQARMRPYYQAFFRAGVGVDIVQPSVDFSKYKLVVAVNLYVLPDELAKRLAAFVKHGGVLLADARTGVKDETGLCHARTLPGLLSDTLGIEIEEYDALGPASDGGFKMVGSAEFAGDHTAVDYADYITPKSAKKMVGYAAGHLEPFAAVTRNAFGKGIGWYVGTVVKEPEFYDTLIGRLTADAKITPILRPPAGVEAGVRSSADKKILFLINHTEETKIIAVPAGKKDLLNGGKTGETVTLAGHGVAVVRL